MEYPLYQELLESAKARMLAATPNSGLDIARLSRTINSIPNDNAGLPHIEEIYALILHHATITNEMAIAKDKFLPYSGNYLHKGKGPLFQMKNFPAILQHILALYIELYSE